MKEAKILLIIGRRLIGRYLPGSDLSPSFLKSSATDEAFQQEGKQDSAKHLLYSLARTGENSGEHILRTMAGILLLWMHQDCRFHEMVPVLLIVDFVSVQYEMEIGKLFGTIINGEIA